MLVLKEHEVCPYHVICPYVTGSNARICQGTNPHRNTVFTCQYVRQDGSIDPGGTRNPLDKTGRMEILLEKEDG